MEFAILDVGDETRKLSVNIEVDDTLSFGDDKVTKVKWVVAKVSMGFNGRSANVAVANCNCKDIFPSHPQNCNCNGN